MFALLFVIACGSSEPDPAAAVAAKPAPAAPAAVESAALTVATSPKATEALAVSDAADGVEDKVAHKCAGCALGMDGSAEHAVNVDGTTLHLCSAMCKEYFTKDPTGNLESLLN
ncbi:MAG: hypothetical protein VX127_09695 [Myxococcota bacterium]|nr:hypothetical protein [Myxococcota bacterium]